MSEVPPGNVLYQYRRPDHLLLVGADAQEKAYVPISTIELLTEGERLVLRTVGHPLWEGPEPVRDELRLLETRLAADADRGAIDSAIDVVEYACKTGTGVAVVPPVDGT